MEVNSEDTSNKSPKRKEEELLDLAKKELLREIKCASLRAEQFGAHSWAKPQHYVPSKRFLKNLLISASRDNDRREQSFERRADSRKTFASKSSHFEHSISGGHSKRRNKHKAEKHNLKDRKKSKKKVNRRIKMHSKDQ